MELRHLYTFQAVAEGLSFTRAAERLSYAQSSVTAQIQALEAELGTRLFERLGKRVVLTDAGRRLQGYAAMFAQLEAELRLAVPGAQEAAGTLHVGAPESLCAYRLPPLLARFHERWPRIKLVFTPGACWDLRRLALEGALDVIFCYEEGAQADGLVVRDLVIEPVRVVAHPAHALAGRAGVGPADLAGETILHMERGTTYRELFERAVAAAGLQPDVPIEFSSIEAIKQCAIAGMGIAVLPEMAVEAEIAQGRLAALAWCDPELVVVTRLAWHKDKWRSPALGAFLDEVEAVFPALEARR